MAAHEAVHLQLQITARVPRGAILTQTFLDRVVRHWAATGDAPQGMRVRIIDWKNPRGNYTPSGQKDARLAFRGLLQEGRVSFEVRHSRKGGR